MKITVWIRAAVVGLIATLVGCATPVPLVTSSGKPEVTIEHTALEEVKNALTSAALDWGYTVKSVTDYVAVYEKANTNALSNAMLASRYDPNTRWRLTYSFATLGSSVRVVTDIALVTNPGSAFERLTDFSTSQDAQQFQQMLVEVKRRLESEYTVRERGKVGIAIDPKLIIVQVREGSPAALAGLKVGDRLVRIDGEPMLDYTSARLKITGEPGTWSGSRSTETERRSSYPSLAGHPDTLTSVAPGRRGWRYLNMVGQCTMSTWQTIFDATPRR